MTDDDSPPQPSESEAASRPDPRKRADAALHRIAEGGDVTAESFTLANQFTDEATANLSLALRKLFRRR